MINPKLINFKSETLRMQTSRKTNFEKTTLSKRAEMVDGLLHTGRCKKLNKTKRGGGVKGAFRNAEGKDSMINQEKYFAGA